MGCGGSKTKDREKSVKCGNYNLSVSYTLNESEPILAVGALDETKIIYGLKGKLKKFNNKTKEATDFSSEHQNRIDGIKFLKSKLMLTFAQDKLIKIWDINKNESLFTLTGHTSLIWDVIELEDGRLASTGDDQKLLIWNLNTKALDFALSEGKVTFAYLVQLSNKQIVTSGGNNKKLMFWDLGTKSMTDSIELDQKLWGLALISGERLAIGCGDGEIKIFNVSDKTTAFILQNEIKTCVSSVSELEPGWLMSTTESNSLFVWNLNQPGDKFVLDSHSQPITGACKISDKVICTVGKDNALKIWG